MSADRFTLDADVLVYTFDVRDRDRHEIAVDLVHRARGADCILTLQALGEFYFAVARKKVSATADAADQVRDWMSFFPTIGADRACVQRALAFAERGQLSYWDALLVATAAEAGCRFVLSENMHDGGDIAGMRVLNPFAGAALPAEIERLLDVS
jgi:predicted nucleic acid-binding protein